VVLATHSAPLLRRVDPGEIRHLSLDYNRRTRVATIEMPVGDVEAAKFVREAVQAYPELYFARLVVLGEGDSEEIVLPRLLSAHALVPDHVSVSVVPLGGRHVNHFWRLLTGLGIPHVTLLDLDAGRHQGSWGRLRYALAERQLYDVTVDFTPLISSLPAWDHTERPDRTVPGQAALAELERVGVFFSAPLDLDYAMLAAYPNAHELEAAERLDPDDGTLTSVLGKARGPVGDLYEADEQRLFEAYRRRFKAASKPVQHLKALGHLTDEQIVAGLPDVFGRLIDTVATRLEGLPE
jgi:putative ATP-dependent endonuclease of OLD family